MNLKWDDNLLTGIENIDSQHKELFEYLNRFLIVMNDGKGKEEISGALNFLEEYVIKHFNDEEEIQKKYEYPRIQEQYKQHEEFKKEIKQVRTTFDEMGESVLLTFNIQNKIIDWIKNHIYTLDRDLGEFIKNKKENKQDAI